MWTHREGFERLKIVNVARQHLSLYPVVQIRSQARGPTVRIDDQRSFPTSPFCFVASTNRSNERVVCAHEVAQDGAVNPRTILGRRIAQEVRPDPASVGSAKVRRSHGQPCFPLLPVPVPVLPFLVACPMLDLREAVESVQAQHTRRSEFRLSRICVQPVKHCCLCSCAVAAFSRTHPESHPLQSILSARTSPSS